jgi:hypothetical protein
MKTSGPGARALLISPSRRVRAGAGRQGERAVALSTRAAGPTSRLGKPRRSLACIKNGITSTTFKTVPDVPFETFELTLPQGRLALRVGITDENSMSQLLARLGRRRLIENNEWRLTHKGVLVTQTIRTHAGTGTHTGTPHGGGQAGAHAHNNREVARCA